MMARDIIAGSVSTVPFESCFSSTNRILTDKRTKLHPLFKKLMYLKDWTDVEDRMQDDTTLDLTTRANPTQKSGTNMIISQVDNFDGACDINVEDSD
jgi:DNA replication protein DnaD